MNKKHITILLVLILLISVCTVLIINQKPELTASWTAEYKAVFKQYVKVFGFLSVMGLVFLRLRKTKEERLEEQDMLKQEEEMIEKEEIE